MPFLIKHITKIERHLISVEQKLASIALCKIIRLPDILVNFFIRFGKIFPQRIVWGAKIREKRLKFIV